MKKILLRAGILVLLAISLVGCSDTSAGKAIEIGTTDEFHEIIENNDEAYVYFYEDVCRYCHVFGPFLDEAIDETGKTVYYYDRSAFESDDQEHVLILYDNGIETVPTMARFENGVKIGSVDHANTKAEILAFME